MLLLTSLGALADNLVLLEAQTLNSKNCESASSSYKRCSPLSLFLEPLKNLKPVNQLILSNCKCKNSHQLLSQSCLNIMRPHIHTFSKKAHIYVLSSKLKNMFHEYKFSFGTSLQNQMENDLLQTNIQGVGNFPLLLVSIK